MTYLTASCVHIRWQCNHFRSSCFRATLAKCTSRPDRKGRKRKLNSTTVLAVDHLEPLYWIAFCFDKNCLSAERRKNLGYCEDKYRIRDDAKKLPNGKVGAKKSTFDLRHHSAPSPSFWVQLRGKCNLS